MDIYYQPCFHAFTMLESSDPGDDNSEDQFVLLSLLYMDWNEAFHIVQCC